MTPNLWTCSKCGHIFGDEEASKQFAELVRQRDEAIATKATPPERIVAAAVLWLGATVTMAAAARHHTIMHQIAKNCPEAQEPQWGEQGFITSKGRFVSREVAHGIAMRAGQIIGHPRHPRELFSEDLW